MYLYKCLVSVTFRSVSSSRTELSFKRGYRILQPVGFPKKTKSLSSPKSITTHALFPTYSKDIVKYLYSFYELMLALKLKLIMYLGV